MQNKPFQVKWGLNTERQWASLFNSDFSELSISGVYIIWGYNIHNSHVIIKVGQSRNLSERLPSYQYNTKDNKVIEHLDKFSNMYVTWAKLPRLYLDGVENYLGKHHYRPLIAGAFPDASPIAVNCPF